MAWHGLAPSRGPACAALRLCVSACPATGQPQAPGAAAWHARDRVSVSGLRRPYAAFAFFASLAALAASASAILASE